MGGLPLTQLRFRLLNCIMILSASIIKEQRHHVERVIWYTAYHFKEEKRDQPDRDGRAAVGLYFGGKQMGTWQKSSGYDDAWQHRGDPSGIL